MWMQNISKSVREEASSHSTLTWKYTIYTWAAEEVNNFKMREGKYVNVTHIRFIESTAKTILFKKEENLIKV